MDQLRPSDTNSPVNIPHPVNSVSFSTQMGTSTQIGTGENQSTQNSTTREYDIDNIKPENKLFTVDLMGGDEDVKFASVKTPDARPDVNNNNTSYINPSPISGAGNNSSGMNPMGGQLIKSRDELRSGVKAAIMVVDYVISLVAMKIAGDTRQQAHTADNSQKKLLEDVIVEYLFGKQQAMPLWLTLVFAIAGSYGLIIFAAIRQRSQINKNKKLNSSKEELRVEYRDPSGARGTQGNTQYTANESQPKVGDVRQYEVARPANNPQEKLTLNKVYSDKNKDGVMEPIKSFTETIAPERPKSSSSYPDKDLVADSVSDAWELVSKGQYPKFKKNLNGKIIPIRYNENGLPILAGNPRKAKKRKS